MPIYIVDEEIYDVPEVKASAFERKYPNAKVCYQDGGKIYHLPLSMREGFAKKHPNAVLEKEKELFTRDQASNSPMKPEIASPYSATPADYTQPTEAQRNFEERGNFEPIGQGSVELNGQDVPVLVGAQGQFRVPSPVKLDEQQEIFRHGNPSQEEVREEQSRAYRETMQGNYAKMDEIDKSISERMGELTSRYFKEYGGTAQSDAMGEPAYMNALKSNKDYINLRAAYNLIEDARKRDRQVRRVDDGFFVNTGRAAFETAADARTWDFGAMELSDAMSLYEAVQKDERGEKLTDSERLLLDAFESNSLAMVQNKHGKQSAGELAGATTVEMIPFIAQIIANPLAKVGTAASKGAAKAVSKWLYKRIGDVASKAARKAVYTGARGAASVAVGVPADLVGGAGVAVTSNAMKTGADVYDRLLNGDSTGEAVAKGIMSQGIEFASENAGRFIAPFFGGLGKVLGRGAEWGLNKIGAGKVVNLAKDYAKKAYSPAFKEFIDKTQWHGFFGEYGEEIIGGLENAALVGDMSASEVFSKDNLFDTAVGLSVSSVVFPAVATANYIGTKHEQRKAAEEAEKRARAVFGDKWPTFRAAVVGAKNSDELGKAVSRIYQQEGKQVADSKEVKALYEYASKYYAYNALKGINPEKVAYMSDEYKAVADNFSAGETMTPEELQVASMEARRAFDELVRLTGMAADELAGIGVEDALNRADEAEVNGDMELAGLWRSYIQSAANLSGNERAVKNQIEQQSAASDAEVDALSNNGMIVSATLKSGENVNIVGGNIVLNADGSINEEASDKQLIVVQDGERKTIGIASIGSVDGSVSVDEEKARRRAAIEEEARRQQMIDRGDVHVFTPGETFSTPMGEVQFVEDNGDGTASVTVNGANTVVSMEGLNNLYSQTKQAEYNASKRAEGEKGEKGSEGNGQQPNVVQESVLSPAEQRKQKRAEVAKRIPMEGKKRLWTMAKPEDVAEYISLLESDPAKQLAMVDKYLAKIAEAQEKLDAIEAAELNEDVEFWNGVKGLLGAQTENVARENNVVSKTDGVEAEVDEPTESVSKPKKIRGRRQVEVAIRRMREAEAEGNALEAINEAFTAEINAKAGDDGAITAEEQAEVDAVKRKYAELGYEIRDMTGKEYNEGMRLEVDFVIDESLPAGARVIRSTRRPYIFKDGVLVQEAKVVVAQSPVEVTEEAPVVEDVRATNEMKPAEEVENAETSLLNENNNVNLQQNDTDNANQDDASRRGQISESVPQGEHGTQTSQVGGAQETAARLRERIESAQRDSKSGLREIENSVTREFAKENGLWIEDESKLGIPFPSGDEHNNYLDADSQIVYKVNNRMHTPSILDLLDRIEQHNKHFPESKYSLVGFTAISKNGDVMPIFAQDFVPDTRMASLEEIDGYMSKLGYTPMGNGRYSNGEVVVKDLHPRNVLVDSDGDIYVVDAEFEPAVPNNEEIGSASHVENTALEQIKAELGVLNADNAAEYARRLYAVNPWSSLEEANAVLKELMKSYGQTLNGQSLGVIPFLDEAQRLMAQESSEKDIVDELRERNENAKEREQRAGFPPRPSDYVDAISKEDATAAKEWEDKFNVYLQKLGVADLPDIDGTISNMQGLKKSIKAGNPKGYKENPNYKAFDYIEKALKKRRKQIESAADSAGNAEVERASQTVEETSNGSTISQESEQVGEQDAGPVNMETLQLNMSEEDFNALLNSGDEAAISEYLAELDDALRMDENSPFAGEMALRDEYKNAVQQYGKENIPAEVMDDLTRRMMPYADLSRAIYNRKYALQDKLGELESAAEKATAAKEKEIKVENKNTAFGGFLADKTDLGASTAEKALNKKYNFDGKVMTVAEFVENAVANGNAKLSTIEEPKYKGASRAAWNRMDAKQQEEDAKKVKESGTKTVYTVNDHDLGKTAYDYAKFLLDNKEQIRENIERIEDVGEKIGGAKKDKLRETIDRMKADMEQSDETLIDKIAKLPISKIFNFDFQKLREGGMPNEAISFMEIVKESIPAKPRTSHKVRRWVNNTLALYKLCLEVGTNWDRVNTILTSRDFAGTDLKAQFDAYMSVGGFDSGLNIGNAKLKQLDKTAGYYKDGKFISSEGKWYVRDAGKHGGIYDTKEEAVEALKAFAGDNAGTTESGKKKEVKFAVYQRREDKSIFIAIKGKSDIVIQDGFKSAKEAFDYIEANNAELQSRYRNLLDKTNADFEENRERKGRDYRNGKDITAEEFRTTFGFRGVEFGNWMTQEDRRKAINECYDALMDLAAVCKVSPKALSLNGTLGMAFGSRGGGKFSAHYEPGRVVINLTKTRGAGTLAHEWFHAMDNYFAKMGETEFGYATGGEGMLPKGIQKYGKRYYDRNSGRVITEEEYNELAKEHTVRREMVDAWEHLMESLKESDYYKRSNAYARLHNSKYWNDPTELGARAFSVWVENELSKQDTSNDYLANNPRYAKAEVTDAQDKYMPYPFDTDADWMDEAFGNLFEVMQERETEDGNVALYQRGSLSLDTDNPAFEAATKNTVEAVKKTGVEVEEATPEMVQAVLGAEMMSVNDRLSQLEKVSKIVANWLKNNVRGRSIKVELPLATQRKIRAKMGRNFGSHVITANNVAHSKKNHGENGIKNTENSIPLRDEDFALMPYIMVSPSYVERGSFDSIGSESVRFYKILSNGYVVVVEKEQKNSPNDMETITMWAELSANVPNARNMRPSKSTSETVTISPDDAAKIRKDAENAIRADVKVEKSTAAAPFYSNAKKAVLDIKQEKATPQQWVAMLKKNGGLKAGEDAWVGLEAWLNEQNGSVTKQQILDFIDENSIRIEEVEYADNTDGFQKKYSSAYYVGEDEFTGASVIKIADVSEAARLFNEKHPDIQVSDDPAMITDEEYEILEEFGNELYNIEQGKGIHSVRLDYTTEGLKNKREIALVVPTIESWNESDEIHFGDAGGGRAVVWVRFGETTDSEGKRVLVIDEIQSKRHQEGREKGYKPKGVRYVQLRLNEIADRLKELEQIESESDYGLTDEQYEEQKGLLAEEKVLMQSGSIPAAPFEKNWHELAMKRMLRYAAENGFDKVAWTTGEQQADRYNLSKLVSKIRSGKWGEYGEDGKETRYIAIDTTNGDTINFDVNREGVVTRVENSAKSVGIKIGDHLSDVVGKDLAKELLAEEQKFLKGDGLKVGGEGMKGFYDRMLPSFVQKYTKKWGAKVGEVTMPTLGQNNTMWSVDVTPQMAEEVMKGQPMFLRTEDGTVYSWAVNGKIFLTPEGMNPNTPAHEYTHLWAAMIEKNDPKLWSRIVEVMKESPTWNEVLLDEAYRDIHNNDSRMASEVLSRLSGEENYRRAMELAEREIKAADGIIEKAKKIALWGRIKQALADFWASVKGVFGFKDKSPWTEFVDMALSDLYAGVNPNAVGSPLERMFIGERGAANLDMAEEASLRLDNLNVAREMEEAGKGAKAIKLATGWERGADGKWRYEVMDDFAFDMSGNVDYGKRKPESLKEYNRYKELLHKKNALAFEGEELPADELAEFKGLEVVWRGTKLHNSERLKDFIDAPELFEAYPELRNVAVRFDDLGDNVFGQYSAARNEITINSNHKEVAIKSALAHEIQHAIQHIEGFAKGGNTESVRTKAQELRRDVAPLYEMMLDTPEWAEKQRLQKRWFDETDDAKIAEIEARVEEIDNSGVLKGIEALQAELQKKYGLDRTVGRIISSPYAEDAEIWNELPDSFNDRFEAYRSLAGEVEARNVQGRMGMTEEERRNSLAVETEDVAREDQVFIEENLGVSASEGKESLPESETGKENSVSLSDNLNSDKHDNTREKASIPNGARAYIEEVARILQTRLGRAEKPTEEVERIIQNFNRGKTIFAHTPLQRQTLALLRTLTNKEIKEEVLPALETLSNKAKDNEQKREYGELLQVVKRFINRNERSAVIEELSGVKLGEEVSLKKIDELFEMYNSDTNVAELYTRVRRFVDELGLTFEFEELDNDEEGGAYFPSDSRIALNAHLLYAPYASQQKKASTIVHEIIHAVTLSAITAKKNNVKLSPKLEKAAQVIDDVFENIVKNNPTLVHEEYNPDTDQMEFEPDYGASSVLEMVAELANPEFTNKLKKLEYDNRSVWQRIWDAIKSIFIGKDEPQSVYKQLSEAFDAIVENFDREAYERSKEDGYKLYDILGGIRSREYSTRLGNGNVTADKATFADMRGAINDVASALNTPIEVFESTEGLTGRRAKAKGWYEKSTGRIIVVLPNNKSVADVMQTVLHEAVAHYGLRKLFGVHFDDFIDNIYNNVDAETRRKINLLASRNGWNLKVATEEYLASLAEDANFERVNPSLWKRIKSFFLDMLAKAGVRLDFELTDDELRYILYRSYQNLKNPGRYRTIAEEAKDIAMQSRLKVGNYAENGTAGVNVAEDDTLFRSDSELAIEDYNRRVLESGYQMQEALQDSMLALKEAQEAIVKETGKAMRDEENAYMAENALSSVNTAEAAEYKRAFYQPLVDELAKVGKKMGYVETYDYLMAKHGIERNREMSVKEALKVKGVVDKEKYDSWRSERNDTIADAKKNGLSWEETQRELDALAGNYGATIRDYSGLSSIYGDNFAEMAYGAVRDFENNVDTNALWARIKAANNATLMKLYNSSILDEETFAQISGMYEYYIPLRGFDEKIAEDVYAYVAQDTGRAGSVMKIARGRHSKAENPVAFIGQMAEQAITQGNRNRVKLRFLNFALSHMTSLLTVTKDVYLRREGDEWVVVTPKEAIDKLNNPTPDQIAEAVQKWEEDMREKVKDSPKDFKKVDAREGIPYKMPNKNLLSEHQVFVKRAGKMFVITVNGSPRLAQALNGLTNPDQGTGIKLIDTKANVINKINRALSTVYTTRNINFVASNFVRDMVYTNSMVWVKESPKYALKFHGNVALVAPKMYSLFSKLENGTLDETNPIEKMFAEFIRNGGETGYTQIKDIEAKKKELKKILAKADRKGLSGFKGDPLGKGVDGIRAIDAWLDHVNRSVENVARFAAYMTSREMGRSVSKSIWDAKEISVNFNKKGAGGKFFEANGQTLLGSLAAAVSGTGRGTYVFWNASVQGMYNFAKNAKENPTKALGFAASVFALGVIVSMFAGDDDEYMVLPEYVRRSNICFKFPWMDKDSWVTLPLPIEYKALYGAGEYLTNICAGKEEFDALKAGELISQLLPIDVLEGGGGLNAFMPSLAKPIWEAYITNKSWTGLPVWKDSPFDTENVPQYQRVYRNTSPALVSFTKKLNQMSGGDERETGWIDINPAKLEHVLEGYLGGYATMARQITNLYSGVTGDEDYSFDPKDIPMASRVWKYGDRERGSSGVKDKFYEYKKNHEVVKAQLKGYAKDAFDPKRSEEDRKYSAERVKEIQNSDAFKAMMVFEAYRKALENAHKAVKENDTKENRQREAMLMEQVNEAIEQVLAE